MCKAARAAPKVAALCCIPADGKREFLLLYVFCSV